jgi:hypothetical protein
MVINPFRPAAQHPATSIDPIRSDGVSGLHFAVEAIPSSTINPIASATPKIIFAHRHVSRGGFQSGAFIARPPSPAISACSIPQLKRRVNTRGSTNERYMRPSQSTKPEGRYDKKTMAQDIHALAAVLGHERVRVAGHDIRDGW